MKNNYWLILIIVLSIITSCKNQKNSQISDEEIWKLGWRMIENSMDEDFEAAELQFDSLLIFSDRIDRRFLVSGLEIKSNLNKNEELTKVLSSQNEETLRIICKKGFLTNLKSCNGLSEEKVKNESLKMELIEMYVHDQAIRGNIMNDIILKYGLDKDKVTQVEGINVDEKNRIRLKEIFKEFEFPNKELVGKDAMQGIFLMIQHSAGDKDWQKSQLINIEKAVENGDMDGQSYAYLYDRIKINGGEKQLYGTQFSNVDPVKKLVELADTEDLVNLDNRRRKVGMMPIEMYKKFMLRNF